MIVDIFDGDVFFLSKGIMESYIRYSKERHFFIVKVSRVEYEKEYRDFFGKNNYSDYHICEPSAKNKVPFLLKCLITLKKSRVRNEELDLLTEIYRHRKDTLLIHGNFFSAIFVYFLLLNKWKDLNWICWGNFLADNKSASRKIALRYFFLKKLYRKFHRVICLMQPDVIKAKEKYGCKNVYLCPYPAKFNMALLPDLEEDYGDKSILVGNSGHSVYDYIRLVKAIIPYHKLYHFTFMLPYGTEELYKGVLELKNILNTEGFNYTIWDKVLPHDEYEKKMRKYRYYICPYETQSGLGAAMTMMYNERTVILTGFNLSWFNFLGIKIISVEDFISKIKKNKNFELDLADRKENKKKLEILFNEEQRIKKLNDLLLDSTTNNDYNRL